LEPSRPLADDVAANAAGAAFGDPRLPPVTWSDYEVMTVKVSVLGPLTPVPVRSADELHRTVRPHRDGLLITDGRRRATFLPSVWDQVPERDAFVRMLFEKAGLRPGRWTSDLEVFRYETVEFGS
jgi:AmmeMemoRadiSam system protein A